jgi:phosphatidylinositol glycan class W
MKEHVTEYGMHWNFFLTLAMIPVLRVFLHPLVASMPISFLGLLVASGASHRRLRDPLSLFIDTLPRTAHQLFLSAGLTSYVLNAPRQTLISANKEGLVSLVGKSSRSFLILDRAYLPSGDEDTLRYTCSDCRQEH